MSLSSLASSLAAFWHEMADTANIDFIFKKSLDADTYEARLKTPQILNQKSFQPLSLSLAVPGTSVKVLADPVMQYNQSKHQ